MSITEEKIKTKIEGAEEYYALLDEKFRDYNTAVVLGHVLQNYKHKLKKVLRNQSSI